MTPTSFESPWTLDTHILVYATDVETPPGKQRIARALLERLGRGTDAILIGQVMSEFVNAMLRKTAMSHTRVLEAAELLAKGVSVLGASRDAYTQAWKLVGRHQYQMWNALIIAICAEHEIKTLFSEDAGPLRRPLGVLVVNPFTTVETE